MFNYRSSPPFSGKIQEILDNIKRLKPLPGTCQKILQIVENPNATAVEVIKVIKTDQALAADVIRMANSVSLGYKVPCSSIDTAVVRIGFKRVRALALRSFASGPLTRRLKGYRMEENSLWNHSMAAAKYSDLIAKILSYPDPEDAYVTGLLHDIGKLMLDQYVLDDYQKIVEMMKTEKRPLWEIEENLFGIDHAAIGGIMADKWNLPPKLGEGIRFHHMPSLSKRHRQLVAIINIANALTPETSSGLSRLEGKFVNEDALQILHLNQDTFQKLHQRLNKLLEQEKTIAEQQAQSQS